MRRLLPLLVVLLAALATVKLGLELHRLLFGVGPDAMVDLHLRCEEVPAWFAGEKVYGTREYHLATYPPASFPLLWPGTGWLPAAQARWLWAGMLLAMLTVLCGQLVRASGARDTTEAAGAALLVLASNATGVVIGNGQLAVALLPLLLFACSRWAQRPAGPGSRLLAGAAMLLALVKPNVSAPFFWLLLLRERRWLDAFLLVLAYLALTAFAMSFQPAPPLTLLEDWLVNAQQETGVVGYGSLTSWLSAAPSPWPLLASLSLLGLHGLWVALTRRADLWLHLGLAALVARIFVYHHMYDDVLLVLPMLVLVQLLTGRRPASQALRRGAGALLALAMLGQVLPARLHYDWPSPWPELYAAVHYAAWLPLGGLLLWLCWGGGVSRTRSSVQPG